MNNSGNNGKAILGEIVSINISNDRGVNKDSINEAFLVQDYGLWGDIHAGENLEKQISLLPYESILSHKICPKIKNGNGHYHPGDFGENITLKGIDFHSLKLNTKIAFANNVVLEISKIGRNCRWNCKHNHNNNGGCFVRCKGIFGRIVKGGVIKNGDTLEVSYE
ncbi:MAG: MOSC domain-containing protein [Bacteroidetes bacterium]|jgi:MOSC domain-containing protein YiiM|nr:MOSC domain-containing protein [Bacteroidota bacterium]MBT6687062.1 MOSC domain-containing protein [Bacteroidota bacterium]MBT7142835.1 MOSC domain-containing protein [Bacteroidota bacterium]MBT7492635.1 MOSC domain-containing protein [Bacteroidota bacterium]